MNQSYRKDIDGLRAIAVMVVIIHHLNSAILPGGYIGVDIFFVISGFLISSHIFSSLHSRSFSFKKFYQKRINRIIPALFVVLITSIVLGFFLLSPIDLIRLLDSALSTMAGISNIYFWQVYGNYFAGNTSEAILLHTWSLGVEEQFYLLWPVVLLLLTRWVTNNKYVIFIMLIGVIGTVLISYLATSMFASASYYIMPSRVFELLIGALLAAFPRNKKNIGKLISAVLNIMGFCLIFYAVCFFDAHTQFPGFNALIPCLGAVCIIATGKYGQTSIVLSMKPFYYTGLLSYSLYLWHWPIIAYLNYVYIPISFTLAALILVSIYILSFLTWKFVEIPFRVTGNKRSFHYSFMTVLLIPLIFIAALCYITKKTDGFSFRFSKDVNQLEKITLIKPNELRKSCHVSNQLYSVKPDPKNCVLGQTHQTIEGLLIGDSYANHFSGMVDEIAKKNKVRLFDYTMDACPPVLNYANNLSASYANRCIAHNNNIYQWLKESSYDYLLLAADWPNTDDIYPYLDDTLNRYTKLSRKIIIILNNQPISNAATCAIRRKIFNQSISCDATQVKIPLYWEKLRKKYPTIYFINPNDVMCKDHVCSTLIDGIPLYRDNGHLNDVGSRLIGKELIKQGVEL